MRTQSRSKNWFVASLGIITLVVGGYGVSTATSRPAQAETATTPSTASASDTAATCARPQSPISTLSQVVPELGADLSSLPVLSTVLTFATKAYSMTERIPPLTWRPAHATASELAYFGVPARPAASNTAATAQWLNEWDTHYSGLVASDPCTSISNASAELDVANWSGSIATVGGYTEAYGETTFNPGSLCATQPDSYTNWVGLGGDGNSYLLQNGFWSDHTNAMSVPFFELISPGYDSSVVPVSTSPAPAHGDVTNISTTYAPGATPTVTFSWHDLTNGTVFHETFTSYAGYSIGNFYSGASAEAVDERGTINGSYSALRNFGVDNWSQVQVARGGALSPIRNETSHNALFMKNGSTLLSSPTGGSSATTFTDTWHACQ